MKGSNLQAREEFSREGGWGNPEYLVKSYTLDQSCKNPGMLEPTIPDRSHICRQFCHICKKLPQIYRQFRHFGEIVCNYGLIWN